MQEPSTAEIETVPAPEEPAPAPTVEALNSATFREASFPLALRGYDRAAVHAFLERIAEWIDARGPAAFEPASKITSEFAQVGERTKGILTAAEEAAAKLRSDAREYVERLRAEAEEEVRSTRLNASQKADEIVAEAEGKAERMIEDALARRRRLNQAISALAERRDEITGETRRLAEELLGAVEAIRPDEAPVPSNGTAPPEQSVPEPQLSAPPAPEPTQLEPPDQRETEIHEVR